MCLYIGFALIFAGWGAQIYQVLLKKDRTINILLPVFYGTGCLILLIGNFIDGETINGVLNILCVLLAMALIAVLFTARNKK
jgi:hypothetical protein